MPFISVAEDTYVFMQLNNLVVLNSDIWLTVFIISFFSYSITVAAVAVVGGGCPVTTICTIMSVPLVKFVPTCGSSSALLARSLPYSPVACLSWKSGHFLFPLLFLITHSSLSTLLIRWCLWLLSVELAGLNIFYGVQLSTLTALWCQTPCVDFDSVAAAAQLSMLKWLLAAAATVEMTSWSV